MTDESRKAVEYLNSAGQKTLQHSRNRLCPKNGLEFMDYCRRKAIPEDTLFELGMYSRGKDGSVYTTIPPAYNDTHPTTGGVG